MSRVGARRERERAVPRATGVPRLAKPARHARYARVAPRSFGVWPLARVAALTPAHARSAGAGCRRLPRAGGSGTAWGPAPGGPLAAPLSKPVIAAVRGHCIGGGLQIIITCDARIAADDAILGLPATKEAFLPGMGTYRLPRLIGAGWARHLILSGETIGAEEAHRIGLVNRVVPRADLEHELAAWAARYLEVPRPSLTWAKRLTNRAFDLSFEEFLAEIDRAMEVVLGSEEHQAARRAWRERERGG